MSAEVCWYRMLFLLFQKMGTFDRAIVPILEIVYPFLSQWLNPNSSAVNAIYLVQIKVNRFQFTPSRPVKVLNLDTWLLGI